MKISQFLEPRSRLPAPTPPPPPTLTTAAAVAAAGTTMTTGITDQVADSRLSVFSVSIHLASLLIIGASLILPDFGNLAEDLASPSSRLFILPRTDTRIWKVLARTSCKSLQCPLLFGWHPPAWNLCRQGHFRTPPVSQSPPTLMDTTFFDPFTCYSWSGTTAYKD